MKFYTTQHPYYCGIDLHVRSLYVCILDAAGETILHREIKALPENLLNLLTPYIGNAHLKWAFGEIAVLYLRVNDKAKAHLLKLQKRMSKAKALSTLAHKVGRCVYYMLKNQKVFDEKRFLAVTDKVS
jgi:hypothetical protein